MTQDETGPLFLVDMHWGQQPVRLSAWRCTELPTDAPTTSVHIVAFHGDRVLVVRDRKGVYGFPGGRLEHGENYEQALAREVYEEARAHLKPRYALFAVLKIEYTEKLTFRVYAHDFNYMAMYVGGVRALEPIGADPAGIVTARDLFHCEQCIRFLPVHDRILLKEALMVLETNASIDQRPVRAFDPIRNAPEAGI